MPKRIGKWRGIRFFNADETIKIEEWQVCSCSECGRFHITPHNSINHKYQHFRFCPHCGSRMEVNRMIEDLKMGDRVKCLACKSSIKLTEDTFFYQFDAEYIKCPHCKNSYDVQAYHMFGVKPDIIEMLEVKADE